MHSDGLGRLATASERIRLVIVIIIIVGPNNNNKKMVQNKSGVVALLSQYSLKLFQINKIMIVTIKIRD